jgi:hypothetical protein
MNRTLCNGSRHYEFYSELAIQLLIYYKCFKCFIIQLLKLLGFITLKSQHYVNSINKPEFPKFYGLFFFIHLIVLIWYKWVIWYNAMVDLLQFTFILTWQSKSNSHSIRNCLKDEAEESDNNGRQQNWLDINAAGKVCFCSWLQYFLISCKLCFLFLHRLIDTISPQ